MLKICYTVKKTYRRMFAVMSMLLKRNDDVPICDQSIKRWCENQFKQQLLQYRAVLLTQIGTWLIGAFCYQQRYYREVIEHFNDISDRVIASHLPYQLADYQVVDDFLQEYTGVVVPTYIGSYGLQAETYEDELDQRVEEKYFALLFQMIQDIASEKVIAPNDVLYYAQSVYHCSDDFMSLVTEDFIEVLIDLKANFLISFSQISMEFLYLKYQPLAVKQYQQQQQQHYQKYLLEQQKQKISQRIDKCFQLLCPMTAKLTMKEKQLTVSVLNALLQSPHQFSSDDMDAYVRSACFARRCSNRLKELCIDTFASK